MKKAIIILSIITGIFVTNDLTKEKVVIPKESIRFRVIANSNTEADQALKIKVRNSLDKDLEKILENQNNIQKDKQSIKNNLPLLEQTIKNTLKENNSNIKYTINYGNNYFPSKSYKGVVYNAGNYESLVVKLGKAEGNNFWCVLFPPLCLVDENATDTEYHILVKDLLKKYF